MPNESQKFPAEPAEGSRKTVDRELARGGEGNRRETGARKLESGESKSADPVHTGDRGDEPNRHTD